jgi:hypothetical protein
VPPPPPVAAKPAAKAEDDGNDRGEGTDDASASPTAAPAAYLAGLVDLRGDGHATLLLAIADAQSRSQIVAVRRVQ